MLVRGPQSVVVKRKHSSKYYQQERSEYYKYYTLENTEKKHKYLKKNLNQNSLIFLIIWKNGSFRNRESLQYRKTAINLNIPHSSLLLSILMLWPCCCALIVIAPMVCGDFVLDH